MFSRRCKVSGLWLCTKSIYPIQIWLIFFSVGKEPILLIYQRLNVHGIWHMLLWQEWVQCTVAVYYRPHRLNPKKMFYLFCFFFLWTYFSPHSHQALMWQWQSGTGVYFSSVLSVVIYNKRSCLSKIVQKGNIR